MIAIQRLRCVRPMDREQQQGAAALGASGSSSHSTDDGLKKNKGIMWNGTSGTFIAMSLAIYAGMLDKT